MSNGSGDYVLIFSTVTAARRAAQPQFPGGDALSPLFQAVIEATEEAIYNSLFKAETMTGRGGRTVEALPLDRVREIFRKHGR
jgi:D-aminopeptidase